MIGDNGGNCPTTFTVDVFVNPLPANVVAAENGTISCTFPTATLSGSTSNTNVSYNWAGPLSFTSVLQSPTVSVWGDYTLTVTDNVTGCSATATVNVPTDNQPFCYSNHLGSTCSVSSVTHANTTTNPGYSWTGPGGFTSSVQTVTVSAPGLYTTVTDLSSTCSSTAIVTVGTHTAVTYYGYYFGGYVVMALVTMMEQSGFGQPTFR